MTERQSMQKTLREIIDGNVANTIPQHVLIAGAEGTGKSHMIARLEQDLPYQVVMSAGFSTLIVTLWLLTIL